MAEPHQYQDGSGVFRRKIEAHAPPDERPALLRFADWADGLAARDLARLRTMVGKRDTRWELLVHGAAHGDALVKGWLEGRHASLQLHTSQWDRHAPASRRLLEEQGVVFDGDWFGIYDWHERHLAIIEFAYEESSMASATFDSRHAALKRQLTTMPAKRSAPEGVVAVGRVVTVEAEDGEQESYLVDGPRKGTPPGLAVQGPLGEALLGRRQGELVEYEVAGERVCVRIVAVEEPSGP